MQTVVLLTIIIFFLKLIFERKKLIDSRKSIKLVIHVNGIRGKSTVSRLIDAGVRDGKKNVFTKVTGTEPKYIDIDSIEKPLIRRGKANIKEQIDIIKKLSNKNIDILILECMAVKPEYQKICEEKIIKADIGVITNVRYDHLDEMGNTLEEIAYSLGNTVPKNGVLFTGGKDFEKIFKEIGKKNKSKIITTTCGENDYDIVDFPENVELALRVCEHIGVKREVAFERMKSYKKDVGVLKEIKFKNKLGKNISIINALAANDPDSSKKIVEIFMKNEIWGKNKRYLMINNRKDRLSRLEQFIKFAKYLEKEFHGIIVSGESRKIFINKLKKEIENEIYEIENIEFIDNLKEDSLIIAVGNICGVGSKIINEFKYREMAK